MKRLVLFAVISLFFVTVSLADGYKIKVKVSGISDTVAYLGHHYGDKKYAKDTVLLDKNGFGIFKGEEKLPGGIYLILLPSRQMTYFEFIIDEDQDFSIETDTSDYIGNMEISGSDDNELFYEFQKEMIRLQKTGTSLQEQLKTEEDKKKQNKIKENLKNLNTEKDAYWEKVAKENPKSFVTTIMNAMKDPQIPEFDIPENANNPDSIKRIKTYLYAKKHYFDNIDFGDARLLRTPIFHNKLNTFMKKMVLQHPDSIIKEGDQIVKLSEADTNVYRYILVYMLGYYENTKIMGMDAVFVHFGENYYLNNKAYWADSSLKSKIAERVIALKPNLLGQEAPNLQLVEYNGRPINLSDVKAEYTVLFFFEPSCGHCKKTTPKLHEIYKRYKQHSVEVFAVFTQHDKKEWKDFIDKHKLDWINAYDPYNMSNFRTEYDIYSTPVIYLLDKDKKIIAKRLDVEQVDEILAKFLGLEVEKKEDVEEDKGKKKKEEE